MAGVRLPMQIGRSALAQSARFAVAAWWFPALLFGGGMYAYGGSIVGYAVVLASFFVLAVAIDAGDAAKRTRPSDVVLDAQGMAVEGGLLDGTKFAWHDLDVGDTKIVAAEARLAVRWLPVKWMTGGRVNRTRVPVSQLMIRPQKKDAIVLAEAEGDERESLRMLHDSIVGISRPAGGAAPRLPDEILRCPSCDAPQVPIDAAEMPCSACGHAVPIPRELHERVRAHAQLEKTSTDRAATIAEVIDQPGARRAGAVVAIGRRLMFVSQPAALTTLIVLLFHQLGNGTYHEGVSVSRLAPSDDGVFFYDIGLLMLVVLAIYAAVWSITSAYVSNRTALRLLADAFGAVPPAAPDLPSSCRVCGAPLPKSDNVLVHCVYCATENVIGIDPRPLALRRTQERAGLDRALRRRSLASWRVYLVTPLAFMLVAVMLREIPVAWHVPTPAGPAWIHSCGPDCHTYENKSFVRKTLQIGDVEVTVLPRGKIDYTCGSCSVR